MKKIIAAGIIITVFLCSCTTLPGSSSTRIYTEIPVSAGIHLNKITLEPSHILDGISEELPDLVKSCLAGAGFTVSEQSDEDIYELEIFLHMKKWQYDYSSRESVTLRLELSLNGEAAAYRLYTEDTEKSIDSFSWTFELIDRNIAELASAIYDEK